MRWFIRIADINYQALGFSQAAEIYLKSLNNWDRGVAVELSKLTQEKGASRLEYHLDSYKAYLHMVQGKIPNRFLLHVYGWLVWDKVRLPEDLGRLTRALTVFTQQNNKFKLKNIQQYDSLGDLESAVDIITGINNESNRQVAKNIKTQGSKEIYRDNEWRVIEMTTPEAVCELGKGTKWCTNADNDGLENAKMYLENGPLFLFLQNVSGKWQKFAQATKSLDQVMDILDKDLANPPQSFVNVIKNLIKNGFIRDMDFFENYAQNILYEGADSDFADYFEKQLKEDDENFPKFAFRDILKYVENFGRLKAVEDRIIFKPIASDKKMLKNYGLINGTRIEEYLGALTDNRGLRWQDKNHELQIVNSTYAFDYWKDRYSEYNFGQGTPASGDFQKWEEYEKAILNNPTRSEELVGYLWFINGEKRAGEPYESYLLKSINAKNLPDYDDCIDYAKNCNIRWAELEKIMLSHGDSIELPLYAETVIGGRWPEAEPIMLKEPYVGYLYTMNVLKQRWPELEQEIIKRQDGSTACYYATGVLKRRWPEMEPIILSERYKMFASSYIKNFDLSNDKKVSKSWYTKLNKESQNLTPQQIGLYHNFKNPSGIKVIGTGSSAVFQVPGINQTLNGSQLINQVIGRIKNVLIQNNVHTIDTSPVSRADAIGLAVSSEPGIIHVDIAKIFNMVKNQSLPSVTQLDGANLDKDIQSDIIGKISNYITNQLANTASHESRHNMDYFNSFPKGQFQSSESGAEAFGNQIANRYFRL